MALYGNGRKHVRRCNCTGFCTLAYWARELPSGLDAHCIMHHPVLADGLYDNSKVGETQGFDDVAVCPAAIAFCDVAGGLGVCKDNHGRACKRLFGLDRPYLSEHREAVRSRHSQIEQDQLRGVPGVVFPCAALEKIVQRLFAVADGEKVTSCMEACSASTMDSLFAVVVFHNENVYLYVRFQIIPPRPERVPFVKSLHLHIQRVPVHCKIPARF